MHLEQPPEPTAAVWPLAQSLHAVLPEFAAYVFTGQDSQALSPEEVPILPSSQGVQDGLFLVEYLPLTQVEHVVAPFKL